MAAGGTDVMYWNSAGPVYITASGAESDPSLVRTGDTNTGIYCPAADEFALSAGGTKWFGVDSTGIVTIGKSATTVRHALNVGTATAAAVALTISNGPTGTTGNPVWIKITLNGVSHVIPAWAGA